MSCFLSVNFDMSKFMDKLDRNLESKKHVQNFSLSKLLLLKMDMIHVYESSMYIIIWFGKKTGKRKLKSVKLDFVNGTPYGKILPLRVVCSLNYFRIKIFLLVYIEFLLVYIECMILKINIQGSRHYHYMAYFTKTNCKT